MKVCYACDIVHAGDKCSLCEENERTDLLIEQIDELEEKIEQVEKVNWELQKENEQLKKQLTC